MNLNTIAHCLLLIAFFLVLILKKNAIYTELYNY